MLAGDSPATVSVETRFLSCASVALRLRSAVLWLAFFTPPRTASRVARRLLTSLKAPLSFVLAPPRPREQPRTGCHPLRFYASPSSQSHRGSHIPLPSVQSLHGLWVEIVSPCVGPRRFSCTLRLGFLFGC